MMRSHSLLYALAGALWLTACSPSAPDLYVMRNSDSTATPSKACKARGTLIVTRPHTGDEYDSRRIAVLLEGTKLTYYTGAEWASAFPEQLRDFVMDSFTRTGRYQLVSREGEATAHTTTLTLFVQEADVITPDTPAVHLRMTAQWQVGGQGTPKTLAIDETVPASKRHMPEIIDAYNQAAARAVQKIAAAMTPRC